MCDCCYFLFKYCASFSNDCGRNCGEFYQERLSISLMSAGRSNFSILIRRNTNLARIPSRRSGKGRRETEPQQLNTSHSNVTQKPALRGRKLRRPSIQQHPDNWNGQFPGEYAASIPTFEANPLVTATLVCSHRENWISGQIDNQISAVIEGAGEASWPTWMRSP